MSTTVCADENEFIVTDGTLGMKICGSRPHANWPYDCDPATANPLRVSEDCGLWIPPTPDCSGSQASHSDNTGWAWYHSTGVEVPPDNDGDDITLATFTDNIVNPSDCLHATVLASASFDADYQVPPGANLKMFFQFDDGVAGFTGSDRYLFSDNPSSDNYMAGGNQVTVTQILLSAARLTPGETRAIRWRIIGRGSSLTNHIQPLTISGVRLNTRYLITTQND